MDVGDSVDGRKVEAEERGKWTHCGDYSLYRGPALGGLDWLVYLGAESQGQRGPRSRAGGDAARAGKCSCTATYGLPVGLAQASAANEFQVWRPV
jgi:hypothetical protein